MKIVQIIQSTGVAINQLLTGRARLLEPRRSVPHPRSALSMLLSLGVFLALGTKAPDEITAPWLSAPDRLLLGDDLRNALAVNQHEAIVSEEKKVAIILHARNLCLGGKRFELQALGRLKGDSRRKSAVTFSGAAASL